MDASNVMFAWSTLNELIKQNVKTALAHETGNTVAQYTVYLILLDESCVQRGNYRCGDQQETLYKQEHGVQHHIQTG